VANDAFPAVSSVSSEQTVLTSMSESSNRLLSSQFAGISMKSTAALVGDDK